MPIIPLTCPSCGANLTVDSSKDAAICEFCGKPYVVKDAIVNNYINMTVKQATIHAETINVATKQEFEIQAGKLIKYVGEKQEVIIPDSITEIDDSAFENLNVNSVVIPDSVTYIGRGAFQGCKYLKSITIPSGVKEIRAWTFRRSGLSSIHLPKSVSFIGAEAFAGCSNLSDVSYSDSAKICDGAFRETPFWSGKCQNCGRELTDAPFIEQLRGYSKRCKACGLVYK